MARLIDADRFKRYIDCGHFKHPTELAFSEMDVVEMIDKQPTIDAVEVVRCKDCVYRKNNQKCPKCHAVYNNSYEYILDFASDEDFCHKGKRGTDE